MIEKSALVNCFFNTKWRRTKLIVVREGGELHAELKIELESDMTIAEADKTRDNIKRKIMNEKRITDVIIEFDVYDDTQHWDASKQETKRGNEGSVDDQGQ